ncbi:hypothetical protein AHF37_10823 [Paragonimus kellicotti]|nr:hypothetical protein AHF37_10823 [Paragonimus kellicotti]
MMSHPYIFLFMLLTVWFARAKGALARSRTYRG